MRTFKRQVLDGLSDAGWELLTSDDDFSEWWRDEQWLLESHRESYGRQLFITYVVDPMWEGPRRPGQGINAIRASRVPLTGWNDESNAISTLWMSKRQFNVKLAEFLENIRAFQLLDF